MAGLAEYPGMALITHGRRLHGRRTVLLGYPCSPRMAGWRRPSMTGNAELLVVASPAKLLIILRRGPVLNIPFLRMRHGHAMALAAKVHLVARLARSIILGCLCRVELDPVRRMRLGFLLEMTLHAEIRLVARSTS